MQLWLLNRIDSATSGVVLVAADESLAREIRAQFKRKRGKRRFGAKRWCLGRRVSSMELWKDNPHRRSEEERAGAVRGAALDTGRVPAETKMIAVRTGRSEPRVSLLRLEPHTGRSHQLRAQCAKRGMPIVGDQTYGNFPRNREFAKVAKTKRMFLHSLETSFDYEFNGKAQRFTATAPLPAELMAACCRSGFIPDIGRKARPTPAAGLTKVERPGTPSAVNRSSANFFSFAFWGYFTSKHPGGCREI